MAKKKLLLERPGPKEIPIQVFLKRLDGMPFFYQVMAEGKANDLEFNLSVGLNGAAIYIRVGEAWYAIPTSDLINAAVPTIVNSVKDHESKKKKKEKS